jgi:hypothetical protein
MSRRAAVEIASPGFTVTELIVAMLVSMLVCGSLAVLAGDARAMFRVQPETADLLQRARVGHELLLNELSFAGAGLQSGHEPQPLVRWIPPVLPYVRAVTGTSASDADGQAFGDRLTLIGIPGGAPQASIDDAGPADRVPLAHGPGCGSSSSADPACGFAEGQRVLLFDASPAFDIATVHAVTPMVIQLEPTSVSKAYRAVDGARVAVASVATFSFDAARRQLRRSTGDGIDVPALDEVVELSFRYFADPYPPEGPRPPPGESNCLFEASGVTRLPVLAPDDGSLIELPLAAFTDGPFCGTSPYRFDADLYRIRRVHVRLRLQAASAALRGRDPLLFRLPGHSTSARMRIPDMVVEFDIAPRNLQVR